jgi:hypothetical protein
MLGNHGAPVMTGDPQTPDRGSLLHGFLVAAGWNALAIAIAISVALMAAVTGIFLVAGFGLMQFAWLLPVRAGFVKAGKSENAKGVLIAAGITVLLSAACFANLGNMNIH